MITLRNLGKLCVRGVKSQIPLHTDCLLYVSMFTLGKIRIVGVYIKNFEENRKNRGLIRVFSRAKYLWPGEILARREISSRAKNCRTYMHNFKFL
jgi:hypothetical protein